MIISFEKRGKGEASMVSGAVVNFCRSEHISFCTASDKREQSGCSFYERSRNAERCMYFIFNEYCDCLKAQLNSKAHE
jgi:hypothetical protein